VPHEFQQKRNTPEWTAQQNLLSAHPSLDNDFVAQPTAGGFFLIPTPSPIDRNLIKI